MGDLELIRLRELHGENDDRLATLEVTVAAIEEWWPYFEGTLDDVQLEVKRLKRGWDQTPLEPAPAQPGAEISPAYDYGKQNWDRNPLEHAPAQPGPEFSQTMNAVVGSSSAAGVPHDWLDGRHVAHEAQERGYGSVTTRVPNPNNGKITVSPNQFNSCSQSLVPMNQSTDHPSVFRPPPPSPLIHYSSTSVHHPYYSVHPPNPPIPYSTHPVPHPNPPIHHPHSPSHQQNPSIHQPNPPIPQYHYPIHPPPHHHYPPHSSTHPHHPSFLQIQAYRPPSPQCQPAPYPTYNPSTGKISKFDFPHFYGEEAQLWITQAQTYFEMYFVDPSMWVRCATMQFKGAAGRWLQSVEHLLKDLDWSGFCALIHERFSRDHHELLLRQMCNIRQTSSVSEYVDRFVELVDQLKSYNPNPDLLYFITRFIDGLRDDIRDVVIVQRPSTLDAACTLALLREEAGDQGRRRDFKKTDAMAFPKYTGKPSLCLHSSARVLPLLLMTRSLLTIGGCSSAPLLMRSWPPCAITAGRTVSVFAVARSGSRGTNAPLISSSMCYKRCGIFATVT